MRACTYCEGGPPHRRMLRSLRSELVMPSGLDIAGRVLSAAARLRRSSWVGDLMLFPQSSSESSRMLY